jgi:hypothetical protein
MNTGTETCDANGTWVNDTCDSNLGSTTEVCDGLDNDCNGFVDDSLAFDNLNETCYSNALGACNSSGVYVCANLSATVCNAVTINATVEDCDNGLDDDCDGFEDVDDDDCDDSPSSPGGPSGSGGRDNTPLVNVSNVTNTSNVTVPVNDSGAGEIIVETGEGENNESGVSVVEEETQSVPEPQGVVEDAKVPFWKSKLAGFIVGLIILAGLIFGVYAGVKASKKKASTKPGTQASESKQASSGNSVVSDNINADYELKLKDYIKKMRSLGVKDEEIIKNLLKAGNEESVVNRLMNRR